MKYKTYIGALVSGISVAVICTMLLIITSLITKEMIKDKCYESAVYFSEQKLFPYLSEGAFYSRQDNYADCILTNIIYHIDSKEPLRSTVEASYYSKEREGINLSFLSSIENNLNANTEYIRYWHGSMVFLRPLLTFMTIPQIRVLLAAVVWVVILVTAFLLYRKKETIAAICLVVSVLLIHGWMLSASIEYVTTFLVMAAALLLISLKENRVPVKNTYALFASVGVVTSFVDFLTTETITFTMPMALILLFAYRRGGLVSVKSGVEMVIKNGIAWFSGYAGMFLFKWGLGAVIFGRDALLSSIATARERIEGQVYLGNTNLDPVATKGQQFAGALWHNIGCLFPIKGNMSAGQVFLGVFVVFLLCLSLVYLLRMDSLQGEIFLPMAILAVLPYLRYIVLSNHSYIHYFFTYRAQLITVFVLLLFVITVCKPGVMSLIVKQKKKRK